MIQFQDGLYSISICVLYTNASMEWKWGFASMKAKIDSRGVTYTTSKDCFIVDWDKVQHIIYILTDMGE